MDLQLLKGMLGKIIWSNKIKNNYIVSAVYASVLEGVHVAAVCLLNQ